MVDYYLTIPIFIGFFISLFFIPFWIRKAKGIGLIWRDMNKFKNPEVAGSGGIIVTISFVIGVLSFITYRTFILESQTYLVEIIATLAVVLFLGGIGFVDDLLGWVKGGLSKRSRLVLVALASVPLMAINAGRSGISLPIFGHLELGILYPLVLIPLGIVGASTTFNFLAGFNGLETGQGILILSGLSIVAFLTGNSWISVISLIMVFALLAFLVYNFYPAKVFPGDSLTYSVGGLIAIVAVLGNFEKIAIFFFIPYIIETILKVRGKLVKYSFGKPNEQNDELDLVYEKIYSLNHLAIWAMKKTGIKPTEKRVVSSIWIFQMVIILLGFALFRNGIF